jgi:hypothetical protein
MDANKNDSAEVANLRADVKNLETKLAEREAAHAAATEQLVAAHQVELAAASKTADETRKDAADKFRTAVANRVALQAAAVTVLGLDAKVGDKSIADATDRDLKEAVVLRVDGDDMELKGKTDDYVNALFDGALRRHARSGDSRRAARETVNSVRADARDNKAALQTEESASNDLTQRLNDAWKTKKGS